jgi:hypothetical protein
MMPCSSLVTIAKRHCRQQKPGICLKPFVREAYGVSYEFLLDVSSGRRPAPARFLRKVDQTHARVFPANPVLLKLPNDPPVLLGHHGHAN